MGEAGHIIEGLLKNTSEGKPACWDSTWCPGQGLAFYRPSRTTEYVHVDARFGEAGSPPPRGR
ncbi:hypothetical protein ACIRQQ_22215 [Streptomyces fuscichromogenes]|uniref:hypothetical protein n=1 Tax=Streptomyces fuscichromogenes TaxID=1324013 RepID=UPI003821A2A5